MSLRILYFASLREALCCSEETLTTVPEGVATVAELRAWLSARGGDWGALTQGRAVRAAVNQTLASPGTPVAVGDEVAFFPPVTGG